MLENSLEKDKICRAFGKLENCNLNSSVIDIRRGNSVITS